MTRMEKEKLIVVIGPTAVGKTNTSISLAKRFDGEVISGDSMQIYKKMDIGTAKITTDEMDGVPHHLIDIKNPEEPFSVAEFQKLVRKKISEIHSRGKTPLIVGGTGLYIQSVLYDYQFTETPGDEHFRAELEAELEKYGSEWLHRKLVKVDPDSAGNIHPNNTRRVIRALEIFHCTGKTMSEYQSSQTHELQYDVALIGLTMDREKLYKRINLRVDLMIEQGLLEEVKALYDGGVRNVQSVQAIGYKELYDYFDGIVSLETAIENLKQNSRRYAKRQLTWFRNKMEVAWYDMTEESLHSKNIEDISEFIAGKLQLKSNK
ncbi:tRNA (adenosine(37)-N6)-dimethylallyltransferase MiaA [Rossellomorea vietnamensis]|nr:tRNA (adenosine(37)-N6)-dimethylallyltransferase MiaA [Rossellomorea vietnamensis]